MKQEILIYETTDMGRALRNRRHELGMSKADAASALSMSVDDITAIEGGYATATLSKAIRYANHLRANMFLQLR